MKKRFLLSAALAATMCAANAQTGNVVVNGDFEAEYESYSPYDYAPDDLYAKAIPGWNIDGNDKWNGLPKIAEQEPDGDVIMDDNYQFLRLQRKADKGWANITAKQEISVVAGSEYTMSFLSRESENVSDWLKVECGYKLYDKQEGGVVLSENTSLKNAGWTQTDGITFTPNSDKIILVLYINNDNYDGGGRSDDTYIDFDNIEIIGDNSATGITSVNKGASAQPTAVYDLSGCRLSGVASEAALRNSGLKGVFVVKQDDKARKVAIK